MSISVTLWGSNASKSGYEVGKVLALRGARVSEFGGKTLNSANDIYVDPDHKRTQQLKMWFDK
jgi:replication factor A1